MKAPVRNGSFISEQKVRPGKKDSSIVEAQIAYRMADRVSKKYGFSGKISKKLTSFLRNYPLYVQNIEDKIDNALIAIQNYGYTYEEAIQIFEENFEVLVSKDQIDLKRVLAILNNNGYSNPFDGGECLLGFASDDLYSMSEYIKSLNVEVNEKNIVSLYYCLKDSGRKYLKTIYPLTPRKLGVIYYQYEKDLKAKALKLKK